MADPKAAFAAIQEKYGTKNTGRVTGSADGAINALAAIQQKYAPQLLQPASSDQNTNYKGSNLNPKDNDSSVQKNNLESTPRPTTSDGFYSRPELGTEIKRYENTFNAAESTTQLRKSELERANAEAERLGKEVTEKGKQLEKLYSFVGDGSDALTVAIFKLGKQEYLSLMEKYEMAEQKVESACSAYELAWNNYSQAAEQYNEYITGQKGEYDTWRGTIRGVEEIQTELTAVNMQIDEQIAALEKQKDELYKETFFKTGGGSYSDYELEDYKYIYPELYTQVKGIDSKIAELETNKALLQEELDWANYFRYADLTDADDFANLSKYITTYVGGEKYAPFLGYWSNTGFKDINYDIINRNDTAIGRQRNEDIQIGTAFLGLNNSERSQMTDEEIAIFNYLYAQDNIKNDAAHTSAYEYIKYLTEDLNYRERVKEQEYWSKFATEHPVGSSILSVLSSPLRGISYLGQLGDYLDDGKIDQNAGYNKFSYIPSTIRGTISENISKSGKWGKVGSFAYNTGMSMADFLFATTITGGFSDVGAIGKGAQFISESMALAIMGTGAAADTVISAKDRGLSDGQAFALGTIAGVAEVAMEYISLDKLLKGKWEKNAIQYILKNAFAEGSEEVGTDVINFVADILIAKEKSEWQTAIDAYIAEGKTEGEAFGLALADQAAQMGVDFFGGALSGGTMSAVYAPVIHRRTNTYNQIGNIVRKMGDESIQQLITDGLAADPKSEAYSTAKELQEKLRQNKDVNDYEIGKLLSETATTGKTQTKQNVILPTAENKTQQNTQQTVEQSAQNSTPPRETQKNTDSMQVVLPTAKQDIKQKAMTAAKTELERTAIQYDVPEQTFRSVQRISEAVGKEVVFYNSADIGENGYYDNETGTIYVNKNSGNPVTQIISHELTHSLEGTQAYTGLKNLVMQQLVTGDTTLEGLRQKKQELYQKHGKSLQTTEAIDHEIVAEYIEKNILKNEQSIRQLVREHRSIGESIMRWLDDLLSKIGFKNATERAEIRRIRDTYAEALSQTSATQETVRNNTSQTAQNTADDIMQRTMDMMQFSISETLREDLEDVKNGRFDSKNKEVYLGETSDFLVNELGFEPHSSTMPVNKAYTTLTTREEAIANDGKPGFPRYNANANYHGMTVAEFIETLIKAEEPVAAFMASSDPETGASRDDRIVLVTNKMVREADTKTGKRKEGYAVVIVAPTTKGYVKGSRATVNKTITTYGRESIVKDILSAGSEQRLLYLDKKRSQTELAGVPGSNSLGAIRDVDFKNNIAQFWENVKERNSRKNSKNDTPRVEAGREVKGETEFTGKLREAGAEASSFDKQFSISDIRGENGDYGKGVLLDTNIFDGVNPRNWGSVLGNYVYNNMAGAELTMYDATGNPEIVQLARKNDRVKKDGDKHPRKVLDKLAGYRGDSIRAKAIIQLSEVLETSKYKETTNDHSHQWLDENGWIIRTVYLLDGQGNIYEATLNIADGRDRKILYEINGVHKIDKEKTSARIPPADRSQPSRHREQGEGRSQSEVKAADGVMPSTDNGKGSLINSSSDDRVTENETLVKEQFSIDERGGKDRQKIVDDLRQILNRGGNTTELRRYVDALDNKKTDLNTADSDTAASIVRNAHSEGISVDEYLRRNWEMYEYDGELNEAARQALELEKKQSGRQFSISEDEISAIQAIGRKSVNDFSSEDIKATEKFARIYWNEMGEKSPFFRAWFGDWRVNDNTPVQIATQRGDVRGVQVNEDTGWSINVSGKVFNETLEHVGVANKAARPYLPYINDIIKKAVLLDSYALGERKTKSINSLLMHSMYAVADIGNGPELLKLYVEEMNDPNSAETGKRAYQLQNIENQQSDGQLNAMSSGKTLAPFETTDIHTVADLFAAVKSKDKNFNPKPTSKVVDADGRPLVVYHGTDADITAFDPAESSVMEGSFFFAQNQEDAKAYSSAGKVMSVYVNLQNPVDYNYMPSEIYKLKTKREQVAALKQLGYDGWLADMDTGWGEVSAFYPEQIKSATDNIGTFDKTNPDIRYSISEDEQLRGKTTDSFLDELNHGGSRTELSRYVDALDKPNTVDEKTVHTETLQEVAHDYGMDYDADTQYNEQRNKGGVNYDREMGDNIRGRVSPQMPGEQSAAGTGEYRAAEAGVFAEGRAAGNAGQDVLRADSEGRRLTEEQAQQLQYTAITDESGAPLAVYHFTPEMEFETFAKGDIGFHFGTQEQAAQRGKDLKAESGRMFRAYLNIKNPYRVRQDLNAWWPSHIGLYLWCEGVLTDEQWSEIKSLDGHGYDTPGSHRLREMLDEIGIDGFAYPNAVEGDGDSYIALRDEQIVRTDILSEKNKFSISESVEQTTDSFLDELTTPAPADDVTFSSSAREDMEQMRQRDLDEYWELVRQTVDAQQPHTDPEDKISTKVQPEDQSRGEKVREAWSYFKRKMEDSGEAVTRIGKAVGDKSLYHFYNMARSSSNAATSMIIDERTDIYGRSTGKSLNEIMDAVRSKGEEYYKKFQLYLFHMHNIDRMTRFSQEAVDAAQAEVEYFRMTNPELFKYPDFQLERMAADETSAYYFEACEYIELRNALRKAENTRNKPVFGFDVTAKDSKTIADTLLHENPDFTKEAEEVYAYIDNLLRYRVDSGLITEEDYQLLKSAYPHYVPTYRVFERESTDTRQKNKVQIGSTIKQAAGSSEKLMPLHKALAQQTISVVREGSKNRFGQRLLNSGTRKKAMEHIYNIQEYQSDFSENTFDQPEEDIFKRKNTFVVRENGKLWEMEVSPALYEAVQALSPETPENNIFTRVVRKGNSLFKKLVTGYNPTFLIRNFMRDLQDACLYSQDLSEFIKQYPLAIAEIAKNGKYWRQYKALGGTYSTIFDYDTGEVNRGSKLKQKTLGRVEALNMAVEQTPRLAEFMATVKKAEKSHGTATMEDLMEAMYNAADVTVNFGRSGTFGKFLNANYVPFLNPGIQGFSKMIRNVTETKGAKNWARLVIKAAVLGIAPMLLNALLYSDDEDWDALKDRDKDVYYLFKIGDNMWLKLPKGRTLSLLGMTADRAIDLAKGEDVDWGGFISTAVSQSAPANPLKTNILSPWVDTKLFDPDNPGETWYGTDIENQRLRNYKPGERYDASTDVISKWIGKTFNLSPAKINYLLDQYTGVVGDVLLPLLTPAAERDMFSAAFTIDSTYSNRYSNDFYTLANKLNYAKNRADATGADIVIYRYWNKQSMAIAEVNKAIREIEADTTLSDAEKRELSAAQHTIRNGIMRAALDTYDAYAEAARRYYEQSYMEDEDNRLDEAYRNANREVLGSEYALKIYNKDVYATAQMMEREYALDYDAFYDFYFAYKDAKGLNKGREIIRELDVTDEQKIVLYSKYVPDSQFEKLIALGVEKQKAYDIVDKISQLEPLPGKNSVSNEQKWRAVVDSGLTPTEQLAALEAVSSESQHRKFTVAYDMGLLPNVYVTVRERLPKYDTDGNGSYKSAEVKAALDSFGTNTGGIMLPTVGGTSVSLTNSQKAVLWQLITGSTSAKNNPYDTNIGQRVIDTMNSEKDIGVQEMGSSGIVLPTASNSTGGIVLPMW